mgnify:FL=1
MLPSIFFVENWQYIVSVIVIWEAIRFFIIWFWDLNNDKD